MTEQFTIHIRFPEGSKERQFAEERLQFVGQRYMDMNHMASSSGHDTVAFFTENEETYHFFLRMLILHLHEFANLAILDAQGEQITFERVTAMVGEGISHVSQPAA